ncbi:MAG: hypothetical protein KDH96_11145, partial [Candidatus Riesia sp.]|nr:hypothetical protein [Candidatus Riesia sp.]
FQIGWNYNFDLSFLWKDGMRHDVQIRDGMLDHHLCNENAKSFALKTLAVNYIHPEANRSEKMLERLLVEHMLVNEKGEPDKSKMWMLPPEQVAPYAVDDVILTYLMDNFHKKILEGQGLMSVSYGVGRYSVAVAHMIRRGLLVDTEKIPEIIRETRHEIMDIWHIAREKAGRPINLDSPKQVANWLGVQSTSEKALSRMRQTEHVRLIQRYRKLNKGINSYYKKMMEMADDEGNLRCDMRLHGTISGRIAVRNPPLQSLPTDTSLYRVKSLLIARPGYKLLQADYSQAEIKIACHYGRETAMAKVVASGQNMHDVVSKEVGIPRDAAKRLNFSVIYGVGARTLGLNLDIPEEEAARYLGRYHAKYPGFKRLYNESQKFAERNGYIDLYTGRRRHFNAGYSSPEHKASSNLIQGTVAEITREAQTRLHEELESYGIHQLLQVHDSAIMEVPEDKITVAYEYVREIMEIRNKFILPMTVDIGHGNNLEEAK